MEPAFVLREEPIFFTAFDVANNEQCDWLAAGDLKGSIFIFKISVDAITQKI
jgi:hypothetical protein